MLPPNPAVVPIYADPVLWTIALLSLVVEVDVVRRVFVRRGAARNEVTHRLVLINLVSWGSFLVGVQLWSGGDLVRIVALELLVVAAEAAALRWLVAPLVPGASRPRWRWLLGWSLVGNAVSAALCALLVTALALGIHALVRM